MKRKKRRIEQYMLVLLCVILTGCAFGNESGRGTVKKAENKRERTEKAESAAFSKTDFVMDTVLAETLYGSEDKTEEIKKLLSSLETEQLSWRKEDSVAAQINRKCGQGKKVSIGEDFARWTKDSLDLAKKSQGAFDPTIGNLTRLWNIEGEDPHVPEQEEIKRELAQIGYAHVKLENPSTTKGDSPQTKVSMKKGCTLDLGAVGKGIGCDVVREYLDGQKAVKGAVVAIGGSILTYGNKPDNRAWSVAIQDPEKEDGEYMGVLDIEGTAAVSTSGDYEKYFVENGKKYHHILDPSTGYPAKSGLRSVTVVCRDEGRTRQKAGLLSDGLSTACFVLGKEKALKLLEEYGAEAVFIDREKKVTVTDGLKDTFSLLDKEYVIIR